MFLSAFLPNNIFFEPKPAFFEWLDTLTDEKTVIYDCGAGTGRRGHCPRLSATVRWTPAKAAKAAPLADFRIRVRLAWGMQVFTSA